MWLILDLLLWVFQIWLLHKTCQMNVTHAFIFKINSISKI